ncbi:hypothetical protein AMAG_11383 [Allomyces macrogynus ATCC 38327]|uniref:Cilia- and flagella-associated protein 299 n=1 Tax=Allomyces macrogynus (strain ATCC 38327) TaxID=578462 RepID=A0A0L0SX25_ALLM3|nr:hypothetical protein AMAG_11383 [Allomyces macrogynus ATCC 38327]|eukprot:KNE66909.1 hypothetical protein AMAG_11383 [Allomyces macrogynus ATCC 38327]
MTDGTPGDNIINEFATYEEYLDSQISAVDLFYLEDRDLARQLVELGYRGSGEPLKRDEFDARKKAAESFRLAKRWQAKLLASHGKDVAHSPFLTALADREEANRNGKMTTIIFLRLRNARGQEISGYIDYAHRLKSEAFDAYFAGTKTMVPRRRTLSFFNWEDAAVHEQQHAQLASDCRHETGLLFKNKRDRKVVNVDPKADAGDNTERREVQSREYIQVVLYDHLTRRKT